MENEIQKFPEIKLEDINYLKEWISKQDHLPQNISDELIILIYHSCYFMLERTKQTIETYFTSRTHIPEFFTKRSISELDVSEAFKTSYMIPLKGTTLEGYRVLFIQLKRTDPALYDFSSSCKLFTMIMDCWLSTEGPFPGFVIVFNMDGLSFGHVARFHLGIMKKILYYLQEGLPVRLKGIHYINVVSFIDTILAIMKPFMKKELIDILEFHATGTETLFKFVPQEILPEELGGKSESMNKQYEKMLKLLEDHTDWFLNDENSRVNETKRADKTKSANNLFGIEGSFKKLNID